MSSASERPRLSLKVSDLTITAIDETPLAATLVEPPGGMPVLGTVLINPATAVKRGYYLPFANFLAESGFRALAFDYRGIGGSRPARLRGFKATMHDWAEQDTEGALLWLQDRFPDEPIALVGHSYGGQTLALLPSRDHLKAVITVAAQSGYWRLWPGLARYRIALFWYLVIPALTSLCGYFPAKRLGIAEDLPAGVAREWARWGRHPKYIRGDRKESWEQGFDSFCRPMLAYSFSDDTFAPRLAAEAIQAAYTGASICHRHRRPQDFGADAIGHFGCFRERFRSTLWDEMGRWLKEQLAPPREG